MVSVPGSEPTASVAATPTTVPDGGAATVTSCVPTVTLPNTSVAVHVIVCVPIANRFPAGTPDRTSEASSVSSVAVATPSVESGTTTAVAPAGAATTTSGGTVSTGATPSTALTSRVPMKVRTSSNDAVPAATSIPRPPSRTGPWYENEPTSTPPTRTSTVVPDSFRVTRTSPAGRVTANRESMTSFPRMTCPMETVPADRSRATNL